MLPQRDLWLNSQSKGGFRYNAAIQPSGLSGSSRVKRSVGVTIIAVLSLMGSILALIMGIWMVALAIFIPKTDANIPPAFFTIAMVMGSIFYFLLGAWGISRGGGLFSFKYWTRNSIIIYSVRLALMRTLTI